MEPLLHGTGGVGLERNVEARVLGGSRDVAARVGHEGDVAGLRSFLEEYEDLVLGGLVLPGGTSRSRLSPKLVAAP
jgi:hypothetical protein